MAATKAQLIASEENGPFRLCGDLTLSTVAELWPTIRNTEWANTLIDGREIEQCDGAGAALLFELVQRGATLAQLPEQSQRLLNALNPQQALIRTSSKPPINFIAQLGIYSKSMWAEFERQVSFLGETTHAIFNTIAQPKSFRYRDFLKQCELVGANAVPIVALISILLGIILAFQSAIPMRQFGAELYVANLLGLSLVRELGPLITAILLAGRSGAAFAAEIGTMKVNEEVNALVTFGFDPIRFLVLPRLLAGVLMAPLLTLFANAVGLFGGALVMRGFGIPFSTFWNQVDTQVDLVDLSTGLAKAAIFGFIVAFVGCLRGLNTGNGASAVGAATTQAVVQTLVLLVVADGLFAVVAHHMGW